MNKALKVVLVDDEVEILNALKRVLRKYSCELFTFSNPKEAIEFIRSNEISIVCSDQRMPGVTGIELLTETKEYWPSSHRVMLSAYQDFDNIAKGFNDGIIHRFIAKPWSNREIDTIFQQVLGANLNAKEQAFSDIIGESTGMLTLFSLIKSASGANVPIFIHGETGTGKELVAKACHRYSYRESAPFIAVNCANLSEQLIESQLFGHKKGAFTGAVKDQVGYFELAQGGTLFLDEITTLPLPLQAKLLRVIQEREYMPLGGHSMKQFDAQVVSASSTSLAQGVELGEFREDLYYRLSVIQLKIPRLADREDDVLKLAKFFVDKFSSEHNKAFIGLSDDAIEFVQHYTWPGNVRQLENLLHGVIILNSGAQVTKAMLQKNMEQAASLVETSGIESTDNKKILPLAEIEKQSILSAISQCDGNIIQASKLLEINPSTIYRKMSKW